MSLMLPTQHTVGKDLAQTEDQTLAFLREEKNENNCTLHVASLRCDVMPCMTHHKPLRVAPPQSTTNQGQVDNHMPHSCMPGQSDTDNSAKDSTLERSAVVDITQRASS